MLTMEGRPMSRGTIMFEISAERERQINVEGWSIEHDDKHTDGEMADAAGCYALYGSKSAKGSPAMWPWHAAWWKPKDRRKDLVRAAALIVAELERLERQVKNLSRM